MTAISRNMGNEKVYLLEFCVQKYVLTYLVTLYMQHSTLLGLLMLKNEHSP